ncbi:MAG TPA: hypothetical protein VHX86_10635 [Tepidisphaeraceae bacterium]|jgi:predicted transcriptional regulator|nr:hypothetical protein [Tepidisphaeraceae bacterium]
MATTQGIKLDDATRARLKELGKLKQRSPHWLMKTAIERFLEQEERYEREKREDMERWQQYQLTGRAVPHGEAAKWLNDLADGKSAPCPK